MAKKKDPYPNEDGLTRRQLGRMAVTTVKLGALAAHISAGTEETVVIQSSETSRKEK